MRFNKIVSTNSTSAPGDVMDAWRSGPPGDRFTGITAAQAASAAAKNVLTGGAGPARAAAMAANFIEALNCDKPNRLPASIGALKTRVWEDRFEGGTYMPHRTIRQDVDHESYISHLLSPSDNAAIRSALSNALPGDLSDKHATHLDNLRTLSRMAKDNAYHLIIRGDFVAALTGARDGRFSAHHHASIAETVRNHARCFAIRTAHNKIGILREHSIAPGGDHFAGFKQWYTVGHTTMAAFASPATIIQRLNVAAAAGTIDGFDDDATHNWLVKAKILPAGDDGAQIIDIAKWVRRILKSRRRGRGDYDFTAALNFVARGSTLAAKLKVGDMKQEGLFRVDFSRYRFGLSASEGAAFVALEMLRAFAHIDVCIEAVMAGEPLPPRPLLGIKARPLAFAAVLLRSEGQPDKYATVIDGSVDGSVHDLDEIRGSGRIPTSAMLAKLQNPLIEKSARAAIGIDVSTWFR